MCSATSWAAAWKPRAMSPISSPRADSSSSVTARLAANALICSVTLDSGAVTVRASTVPTMTMTAVSSSPMSSIWRRISWVGA